MAQCLWSAACTDSCAVLHATGRPAASGRVPPQNQPCLLRDGQPCPPILSFCVPPPSPIRNSLFFSRLCFALCFSASLPPLAPVSMAAPHCRECLCTIRPRHSISAARSGSRPVLQQVADSWCAAQRGPWDRLDDRPCRQMRQPGWPRCSLWEPGSSSYFLMESSTLST